MSNVSEKRLKEIMSYNLKHGNTKTIEHYNISPSTLERYVRKYTHKNSRECKILLFDIETLPIVAYTWGLFKPRLSYDNIISDWCCLSWAAKWLFDSEIKSMILTPDEVKRRDDSRIVKGLWDLFEDADIIIAHNLKKFDVKRSNARFMLNGLRPPLPYQVIDTLDVARKYFSFTSNRLDFLGQIMVNKEKIDTDFDLWKKCDAGDQESLQYMLKYNEMDVSLLEEVYVELRPWIKNHPNIGLYMESEIEVCPSCGSSNLQWKGHYATQVGKYSAFRCNECGSIGRCRITSLNKIQKKNLAVSVAR